METPVASAHRHWLRSSDDRLLLGVAGGASERIGVSPTVTRVLFAVAGLMGWGVVTYIVLGLLLPLDDGTGEPLPHSGGGRRLLFHAAIFAALFAFLTVVFALLGGFDTSQTVMGY